MQNAHFLGAIQAQAGGPGVNVQPVEFNVLRVGDADGVTTRPSEDEVLASWRERFGKDGKIQHFHGTGCDKCGGSGLRGRAGVHELMPVSRDVRRLIQTGARVDELQKAAMAEGMQTLRDDGSKEPVGAIVANRVDM